MSNQSGVTISSGVSMAFLHPSTPLAGVDQATFRILLRDEGVVFEKYQHPKSFEKDPEWILTKPEDLPGLFGHLLFNPHLRDSTLNIHIYDLLVTRGTMFTIVWLEPGSSQVVPLARTIFLQQKRSNRDMSAIVEGAIGAGFTDVEHIRTLNKAMEARNEVAVREIFRRTELQNPLWWLQPPAQAAVREWLNQ